MIDLRRQLQHVHRDLDVHAPLDAAPAGGVGELLGGLGDQGVAVVRQPVGQRLQRRIFIGFQHGRVVVCSNDVCFSPKILQEVAIVDIEAEVARGGVEIGAVYEQSNTLVWQEMHGGDLLDTGDKSGCVAGR